MDTPTNSDPTKVPAADSQPATPPPTSESASVLTPPASLTSQPASASPILTGPTEQPANVVLPSSPAAIPVQTEPSSSSQNSTAAPTVPAVGGRVPLPAHKKGKGMLGVIIFLVIAFICGLFIAGWYFQTQLQKVSAEKQSAQQAVSDTPQSLVIGTDATFQPMEYTASGEATLMGYDIDLGNRIGKELNAKVTFKNIPWDNIFTALDNKQVDMIMSSVTITDERKKKYDFSNNYLNSGQVIIVRQNNTTITSAESLQGKKIGVQEGTTNETQALKYTSATMVIRYPDFVQATQALVDGKVDAILSDLPSAKGIVLAHPTLKIASDPLTNDYYGIVFRKGDPRIKKINETLSSLQSQGILTDLKQKWLD